MTNQSIGPARAIIGYGLETDDAWLPELARRVDAGETIDDNTFACLPSGVEWGAESASQTRAAGPTAGL